MTNEQAIKWLKDYIQNTPFQMEQYERAFEMAIQALSQEPCDDAVSREAVINTLDNIDKALDEDKTVENYKALLKECYEVLPSVTPKSETITEFADRCRECGARYGKLLKQKTGHWIYDETIENWRCSKCNETPKTMGYVGTADFMAEHFKFCNHCGAKMVDPQESEDKE